MSRLLRLSFFLLVVRPLVLLLLGLNVRHRERLPAEGPAIIVANHNSHLDTMVLIALFPLRHLPRLRPVAAGDYFLRTRWLAWFSTRIVGIIPVDRVVKRGDGDPLSGPSEALARGEILILFPEGTRGDPEHIAEFKKGIARLAQKHPDVPVIPVFLHGLGKALPRGEGLLVPFFCDVFIGEVLRWNGDRPAYMAALKDRMVELAGEGHFPPWE